MNYVQGLIGAGGLGAVAVALVNKSTPIPAHILGYILFGMGGLILALVGMDAYWNRKSPRSPGDAAVKVAAQRSIIYLAFSTKRAHVSTAARSYGKVFDPFESEPSRGDVRDTMKLAKTVLVILEPGQRRDSALVELGHALPDKELYLIVARHRDESLLPVIEPARNRAAYLEFDDDEDLTKKLQPYWSNVCDGGKGSVDPSIIRGVI